MKERVSKEHVSVGMKLPNGTYERPIEKTHLFWVWPGESLQPNCNRKIIIWDFRLVNVVEMS